jgi:hypothetical protein
MRRALILGLLTMLVAACGGDEGATTTTSSPTTTTEATTTTSSPTTTTTSSPTTTETSPTTTTTVTTSTTLAGEPIDFGPADGDVLMVIGVRHDDVLNLRAGPGAGAPIVDEIPPNFSDLIALGNTRQLPGSFWTEVDYEGAAGWVHMSYIGYEGVVVDQTSTVVDELSEIPVAATMTELGELVAAVFASEEPDSDIVQATPVTSGDLTEVTYDVIGLGDDAVRGLRLHLFAEPVDDAYSLKSVEETVICGRGVDDAGLCV